MVQVLIVGPEPPPEGGVATSIIHLRDAVAGTCRTQTFDTATHRDVRSTGTWTAANVLAAATLWPRLARRVRRSRPDVVHIETGGYLGLLKSAALIWAAGRTPTVLSIHSPTLEEDLRSATPLGAALIRRSIRRVTAIRVEHAGQAAQIRRIAPSVPPHRIAVIPNAVPLPPPAEMRSGDADTEPLRLVSVGSIGRRKGTHELLHAVHRLRAAGIPVRCTLLGPEERTGDLAALRETVDRLQLRDSLELRGRVGRSEVAEALRNSDVFVLPAHAEGLPLALLEAMAAGLPVVATRVGGIGDVVDQPGIELLAPEDVEGLASALVRLHRAPQLRDACGAANRRRIAERFTPEAVGPRFVELWEGVARTRPA